MNKLLGVVILTQLSLFCSCSNQHLMRYYYPIDNAPEVKIYRYKDQYYTSVIDQNIKDEFVQNAYYAKGKGMIKYERHLPNGEIRILELADILTASEFENIKQKAHQ